MSNTVISIIDLIPFGHDNAIGHELLTVKCINYGLVPDNSNADRATRKLLHDAKMHNAIVNIQDGSGYFRPSLKDEEIVRGYIMQEKQRIKNTARALRHTEKLYADMKAGRLKDGE